MDVDDVALGPALLHELRSRLGEQGLEFAEPPQPVSGGFDTRIYGFALAGAPPGFEGRLILRLYRAGEAFRAQSEGAVQEAVRGTGFPVPRLLLTIESDALGGPALVMERAPGATMLGAFGLWPWRMPAMVRLLAQTHLEFHSLDPDPVLRALEGAGQPSPLFDSGRWAEELSVRIERGRFHGLRHGLAWVRDAFQARAPAVLCHGDFHPINILVGAGRVTGLVDWSNFFVGEVEADVAITLVISKYGPVDLPGFVQPAADLGRRAAAARYLALYRRGRPLDSDRLRLYEAMRCLHALVGAAESRTGQGRPSGYAWAIPRTAAALAARFRQISGRRLFW